MMIVEESLPVYLASRTGLVTDLHRPPKATTPRNVCGTTIGLASSRSKTREGFTARGIRVRF